MFFFNQLKGCCGTPVVVVSVLPGILQLYHILRVPGSMLLLWLRGCFLNSEVLAFIVLPQ